MRIGVPTYNGRVSPVLDASERLLLLETNPGESEPGLTERPLPSGSLVRRVSAIAALGLDLLVCGALSREMAGLLTAANVPVRPWVSGETEDVLRAALAHGLDDPRFDMPGCRRRRRRHRRMKQPDSSGRYATGGGRKR